MGYRIIDGKLYYVEEVNSDQVRIEVEQSLKVVAENEAKISQCEAQKRSMSAQYDNQIANLERQKETIDANINALNERKAKACEPLDVEISIAGNKIAEVKARLEDKKDAIKTLIPEAYTKLGF